MVHCHDMKLGQVYVCEECVLELKVEKSCTVNGNHPKGVSCTRCIHVCCDKDMKLRTQLRDDIMCEDVPKKDGSGKGVGQPGKGCDGNPRKRRGRNL
jgi:hypothetical protein